MVTSSAINRKEPLLSKSTTDNIRNTKSATISSGGTNCQDTSIMANGPMQTVAGVMGNVLEWYDFALFGFFSDIIAQVFFPPSDNAADDHSNLIRSFAVYGGAFLMRPVGGLAIGYIGDKHGRKQALVISLFLMAFPTFLMGCLPTYEQVGVTSTVLLVICRLLQGMSVGGQLPASLIYTVEMRPQEHWGYYGSLVMMAANIGTLLGNFVGALLRTVLTDEELVAWGWRIPFLSGIFIAFVAIYLRLHGEEHNPNDSSDEFGLEGNEQKHHWGEVFKRENLPSLASATLTPMLWGGGFYMTFVWMAIFMEVLIDDPYEHGFWINAMALLFGIILPLPLAGSLSDRFGRVRTMISGAIGLAAFGPIMLLVISAGRAGRAFFAQWFLGLLLALFGGPMNAWLVEKFPPNVRLTSAALGYDLAHCTASAFSPLLATILEEQVGALAVGLMYPCFAVLAFCGLAITRKVHYEGGVDNCKATSDVQMSKVEGGEVGKKPPQLNPIT